MFQNKKVSVTRCKWNIQGLMIRAFPFERKFLNIYTYSVFSDPKETNKKPPKNRYKFQYVQFPLTWLGRKLRNLTFKLVKLHIQLVSLFRQLIFNKRNIVQAIFFIFNAKAVLVEELLKNQLNVAEKLAKVYNKGTLNKHFLFERT